MAGKFTAQRSTRPIPESNFTLYMASLYSYYSEQGSQLEFHVESMAEEDVAKVCELWTSGQHELVALIARTTVSDDFGPDHDGDDPPPCEGRMG
jgi:hypothetical protein